MKRHTRRRKRDDSGFTLLEIMIVLALIGLIAGVVGNGVYQRFIVARVRTAKLQVRELVGVVQQTMLDDASCSTVEEMVSRQVLRNVPRDPWATPLVLRCPSEHEKDPVDVVCAGPDKKVGTADDINSWQL